MFAPLHTKSEHSFGYGTAPVEDLVRRAADLGYPALALADVENLYGQVRLHHAARALGSKAITGVELRADYGPRALGLRAGRVVLIARDRIGYESLCRIVTRRRSARGPTPEPLDALRDEPRGVFFMSDDPSVVEALGRAGVDAEDVRFLLVRPGGPAPPPGVRAIADPDVVMLDAADRDLHLAMAIWLGVRVARLHEAEPPERSLPAPARLRELYRDAPEALAETLRVAAACTLDLSGARPVLPRLDLSGNGDAGRRLEPLPRHALRRPSHARAARRGHARGLRDHGRAAGTHRAARARRRVVAAARRWLARGGVMQFVTLEDEHDLVETVIFPGVYASLGDPIANPGPFIVEGRVEGDHGDVTVRVTGVTPFHQRARPFAQEAGSGVERQRGPAV